MIKRPISVTIVSLILIAAGAVGLTYHVADFKAVHPFPFDLLGIEFVRLLAVLAGIFMLRGSDWARWLAIAWIALHVAISFYHSLGEVAMHAVIFLIFAYILFRVPARAYFRNEHIPAQ
jgi:hypothetical protein